VSLKTLSPVNGHRATATGHRAARNGSSAAERSVAARQRGRAGLQGCRKNAKKSEVGSRNRRGGGRARGRFPDGGGCRAGGIEPKTPIHLNPIFGYAMASDHRTSLTPSKGHVGVGIYRAGRHV